MDGTEHLPLILSAILGGETGHKGHQRNKKDNEEASKPAEKEEEKKPSWASILK
jgi:hypothetical protein